MFYVSQARIPHWFRKTVQIAYVRIIKEPIQSYEDLDKHKPGVLREYSFFVAAHRRQFPASYTWVGHMPFPGDPYDSFTTLGVKADCQRLPWNEGWVEMLKARWWLRRYKYAL